MSSHITERVYQYRLKLVQSRYRESTQDMTDELQHRFITDLRAFLDEKESAVAQRLRDALPKKEDTP